jgi:hypothetical protein
MASYFVAIMPDIACRQEKGKTAPFFESIVLHAASYVAGMSVVTIGWCVKFAVLASCALRMTANSLHVRAVGEVHARLMGVDRILIDAFTVALRTAGTVLIARASAKTART